jgi:hypothetical protein
LDPWVSSPDACSPSNQAVPVPKDSAGICAPLASATLGMAECLH